MEVVTTTMPRVAVSVYVLDDLENWIERRRMSQSSWLIRDSVYVEMNMRKRTKIQIFFFLFF